MNINWKRILVLAGFIGAIIVFGYLLYFFFLRPVTPPAGPPTNVNVSAPGGLPTAGTNVNIPVSPDTGLLPPGTQPPGETPPTISPIANGGLTETKPLTTTQALGAALSRDGTSLVYYDRNAGLFYRVGADGKATPLSDEIFFEVQNVTWAPSRQEAIMEYPDGANILYNFQTKKQITLPQHWKNFDFSPSGSSIVFKSIGTTPDNRWLAIAGPDGSGAQKIEHLGDKDASVYPLWSPNNQMIAMFTEDRNFDQQNLFFVGLYGENFKSTVIDGRDFRAQWSSNGDKLLYSAYTSQSGYRPELWIVSAESNTVGENRRNLRLATWADKCSFANNTTIYCAVPQSLPEGAGLFAREMDNQPTDVYKIDLESGFRTKVATPVGNHNITNLMITPNERLLYFTSKTDNKLYSIQLK